MGTTQYVETLSSALAPLGMLEFRALKFLNHVAVPGRSQTLFHCVFPTELPHFKCCKDMEASLLATLHHLA